MPKYVMVGRMIHIDKDGTNVYCGAHKNYGGYNRLGHGKEATEDDWKRRHLCKKCESLAERLSPEQ